MLHVFNLDVAKVDRDVAHVAMVIHVCCKCMFQILQLFSNACASVCFKCSSSFKRMLQIFYLDVVYDAVAIHICCKHMFRMFHLFQTYVAANASCCKYFH
jgi:hypothetical protein